jgi:hypothetical protein
VWPRWLTDALSGKASLARAFWGYGLGVSVAFSVIGAFIDIESRVALTVYLLAGLGVGILQSVIMWRCAYNSPSKLLGRVLRTAVIVGLVIVPIMLYVIFTTSGSLVPSNIGADAP